MKNLNTTDTELNTQKTKISQSMDEIFNDYNSQITNILSLSDIHNESEMTFSPEIVEYSRRAYSNIDNILKCEESTAERVENKLADIFSKKWFPVNQEKLKKIQKEEAYYESSLAA